MELANAEWQMSNSMLCLADLWNEMIMLMIARQSAKSKQQARPAEGVTGDAGCLAMGTALSHATIPTNQSSSPQEQPEILKQSSANHRAH